MSSLLGKKYLGRSAIRDVADERLPLLNDFLKVSSFLCYKWKCFGISRTDLYNGCTRACVIYGCRVWAVSNTQIPYCSSIKNKLTVSIITVLILPCAKSKDTTVHCPLENCPQIRAIYYSSKHLHLLSWKSQSAVRSVSHHTPQWAQT